MVTSVGRAPVANRFLQALAPASLDRLREHLEPIELSRRQLIYSVGDATDMAYFVEHGLVSLVKPMTDGQVVEVNAVGGEGVVCLSALLGLSGAVAESIVHIPGAALRMRSAVFRDLVESDPALKGMVLRYAEFALNQMTQTAACNSLHPLDRRLARWLLVAHDSAGHDEFPLTHEFLALMLGVQRPGVSLAARALKDARLIDYARGRIVIHDRNGLEGAACECYAAMRDRREHLLGPAAEGHAGHSHD